MLLTWNPVDKPVIWLPRRYMCTWCQCAYLCDWMVQRNEKSVKGSEHSHWPRLWGVVEPEILKLHLAVSGLKFWHHLKAAVYNVVSPVSGRCVKEIYNLDVSI